MEIARRLIDLFVVSVLVDGMFHTLVELMISWCGQQLVIYDQIRRDCKEE